MHHFNILSNLLTQLLVDDILHTIYSTNVFTKFLFYFSSFSSGSLPQNCIHFAGGKEATEKLNSS